MKGIITSILIVAVMIGGVIWIGPRNNEARDLPFVQNVRIDNGRQIIELNAKGGYQPRRSLAQAGLPTVIRFNTTGTFDCSAAVRIPSLNYSKFLPQTGVTEVDIGVQPVGMFRGSCAMGMYPFEIDFK